MPEERDPIAEAEPELGPCTTCDHGWRPVTEHYVDRHAPWPDPRKYADPADYQAEVDRVRARRAAYADTHYPCKRCRPVLFQRWIGHWEHYDKAHIAECEECQEAYFGRSRRRPTHTYRKDIDG